MIARNPRPTTQDKAANKFIRGSSKAAAAPRDLVPLLINFPREMVDRITAAASELGINRTAFIVSAAAEKLLIRRVELPTGN